MLGLGYTCHRVRVIGFQQELVLIRETSADGFTYSKISGGMKTFPEVTEAVMASTADDYGTSYYFRGAVENNYVEFANKCWRIVRVTGDGSIKLALFNNNTEGNTNPCAEANDSSDAAITGESKFNYAYGDNAFVGLMYGNVGCSDGTSANQSACTSAGGTWTASTSYANAHANINKSMILKYLEEWYDNNIANYDSYVADTIWCNDKSTVNDTSFIPIGWSNLGTNYGYGLNVNFYGTTQRIIDAEAVIPLGDSPSLICPNDNLGGKLSKYTVSDKINGNGDLDKKIGLLTADEVVYAGGVNVNFSYYLLKNTEDLSGGLCLRTALMAAALSFGMFLPATASLAAAALTTASGFGLLYHLSQQYRLHLEKGQEQAHML